jgi:parvulin-like peptidyl-prolyl isomerase/opacity protein-like surface antigen
VRSKQTAVLGALLALALGAPGWSAETASRIVDEISLVVDQDSMTKGEMEEAISDMFTAQGLKQPAPGSPDYEQAKKDVIESFIREVLLAEEADREKVEISDGEVDHQVDQELENMKKRFASDTEYQDSLKKEGLSEDDLRQYIHDQLLRRMKATRVLQMKQHDLPGSVFVTDDEVKKYFDQHPKDYEQVKFSIILFHIPEDKKADKAYLQELEKQAKAVLDKLKAGGDFAATAKKYSEDTASAQNGGDVGTHYRVDLEPQLADGVFALPSGGLGVVKTADGIYVVKVEHKGTADYDTVAPDIKAHLLKQKQDSSLNLFLEGLKKDAYIVEDGKVVTFKETAEETTPAQAVQAANAPSTEAASSTPAPGPAPASGSATTTGTQEAASAGAPPAEIYPTLPEGGELTLEIGANGFSYGSQDLTNYYGPGLNVGQNFPFGAGAHLGLDLAMDPTFQLGIKVEALRKFTETVNFSPLNQPSYSDQWTAGAAGGELQAKLLIPLDESTNFIVHAGGGYYFLLGASVTVAGSAVTENTNFGGSNFGADAGGAIEFFLDDSKTSSLDLDVGYRYLQFQPITSYLQLNNNGPIANFPTPLANADGSKAMIDFSGVQVGIGVRFYLDKEGS